MAEKAKTKRVLYVELPPQLDERLERSCARYGVSRASYSRIALGERLDRDDARETAHP